MRGGFTLVEVLAAAVIASLAGLALLKMNSSNLFFFHRLQNYSQISEALALAGLHGAKQFDHGDKSLYAMVENSYSIDNDDLRKYLKSVTYAYNETLVDTIVFDTDMLLADDASEDEATGADNVEVKEVVRRNAAATPSIQFELIKISLKNQENHGAVLQVRTQSK